MWNWKNDTMGIGGLSCYQKIGYIHGRPLFLCQVALFLRGYKNRLVTGDFFHGARKVTVTFLRLLGE